jgi:hypothetical protein
LDGAVVILVTLHTTGEIVGPAPSALDHGAPAQPVRDPSFGIIDRHPVVERGPRQHPGDQGIERHTIHGTTLPRSDGRGQPRGTSLPQRSGEVLAEAIPVSFDGTAQPVQAGRIRLFAGLRSDPFFADVEGALHGFDWTGHDDFAGNNVDSIVLEVPDDMLGVPVIGVWASISRYRDGGTLEQLDRGGNPTINPFINPDGEKNLFNSRQPADDVANYLEPWSAILENAGGYTPEAARAAALQVLPDILHYDRTTPATYPNGRIPTDDVYSMRFAWLTNGKVPPSGLKPHDDLLAQFPYLGPPNPPKTSS